MFRKRFSVSPTVQTLVTLLSGLSLTALFLLEAHYQERDYIQLSAQLFILMTGILSSILVATFIYLHARREQRWQILIADHSEALKTAYACSHEDKAEQTRLELELAHSVSHDHLTGLATPVLLRDRLDQAVAYADRYGQLAWVLYADIDHFKFVNDMLDHEAGDSVLRTVAERWLSIVREVDTVARVGGEEFVLVLPECAGENLSESVLQRIADAVTQPITIDGQVLTLSCHIGVAVYPGDGKDAATLIKHAGIAMYRAKKSGHHRFQFYSPAMNQKTLERARIAVDLRNGLERDEFILHYQPQVDLRNGYIVGMEALIRWQHPELGLLSPARFVGLAEELDIIIPIGDWILRTACQQNKVWQDAGLGYIRVAVNLSARQFYQQDLIASITAILKETGLEPCYLEIELTESLAMTDVEQAINILNDLKAIGIQISIDDFGTGYSSLSYLKSFPIDVLKIDQSFVRDIITDSNDAMIATSIISLAHSLRLDVIAEGVETEAQLAYLKRHDCDQMQGFYFSPPVTATEFGNLLLQNKRLPSNVGGNGIRRQTILILDDESSITSSLRRLLHQDDYHILTANTAEDAFEAMALNEVQVILSDQRMPDMTGVEFLSKVKDLYPETIRIMLSGYAELATVIEAVNNGAVHRFFTKPWQSDLLRRHIRDAFRQYWLQHDAERIADRDSRVSA